MFRVTAMLLIFTTLLTTISTIGWVDSNGSNYSNVRNGPKFTPSGELQRPTGFRRWIFIGSPITPNALNGGAAVFPEFHNVYVEPSVFDFYLRHQRWPEGTILVKELQLARPGSFRDGSREEASGRGYFPGAANGLDVSVKDARRFPDTKGWGFFNFGHHAPPYESTATEASIAACAGCHISSAHEDMVFSDFYEQLRPEHDATELPDQPTRIPGND